MPRSDSFIIQWHITEVCNCRCSHCYQSSYTDKGFALPVLLSFFDKITDFIAALPFATRLHINFTGGEPFLRPDFIELLQQLTARANFTFGILSNGLLLPPNQLIALQKLKPKFIQISVEGEEQLNDQIRGVGAFQNSIRALKIYKKLEIPTIISFTANASNYKQFPKVAQIARKYKALNVWTDRYLPISQNDDLILNQTQSKEYFQILAKTKTLDTYHVFSRTKIATARSLQFLTTGGMPYKCNAGITLLAILANGDILPCRRLPIVLGNISSHSLIDIHKRWLENQMTTPPECLNCFYAKTCSGGLRCLSYAQTGNLMQKDPACWL